MKIYYALISLLIVLVMLLSVEVQELTSDRDSFKEDAQTTYLALLDQERINATMQEKQAGAIGKVVELSFYCDCSICTGSNETTKSGSIPTPGYTIAVDPDVIPLGTRVFIEGLGWRMAEDTGGSVAGDEIDVFVESHEEALRLGRYCAYAIIDLTK